MQATFNESDVQSLLTKVKIFNHQIGTYELYTINDAFHYVIKLTNGTIFFTLEELGANASNTLNLEMLTSITRRFTPTVSNNGPINEEPEHLVAKTQSTGSRQPKQSPAKIIVIAAALIIIGMALGMLVFYLITPESSSPTTYQNLEIYRDHVQDE